MGTEGLQRKNLRRGVVRSEVKIFFGSGEGGYFPIFKHDYTVNGVGGGGCRS